MSDNPFDEENEEPWDEFKWEEFLKQSDERADKLGKIIEEHSNDPNLQDIIAREMGWNKPPEGESEDFPGESDFLFDNEEDEEGEEWKAATGQLHDYDKEEKGLPDFKTDPLYNPAFDLGIAAHDWAKSLPEPIQESREIWDIVGDLCIPAAKIAAGFNDEDEPEMLGFRIASYKRGLAAANKALDAMNNLSEKKLVDAEKLLTLSRQAREIRNGLAIRILELREQFYRK